MDQTRPTTHITGHIAGTIRADRTEMRRDLRLRRVQALTSLLAEREDLRGVNAVADALDDAVRWTA